MMCPLLRGFPFSRGSTLLQWGKGSCDVSLIGRMSLYQRVITMKMSTSVGKGSSYVIGRISPYQRVITKKTDYLL